MGFPLYFPHPFTADKSGLLAIGGDLSPDSIILAYRFGIFPWYSAGDPLMWWFPPERFVLKTGQVHVPKSMRRYLNNPIFSVTVDRHFDFIIDQCQNTPRPGQEGTWITPEMKVAYKNLHNLGLAHSIEIWYKKEIVGGLYGLGIGKIFSGESMFSHTTDASKFAVIILDKVLQLQGYQMIDCQQYTYHMELLGGFPMDQNTYFTEVRKNLFQPLSQQRWSMDLIPELYRHDL